MGQIFRHSGPELIGQVILGATIGAVLAGAGQASVGAQATIGAALGAVLMPLVLLAPWHRLGRPARKRAAGRA